MKKAADGNGKKDVCFQITTKPGSKVFLAGTFNQWNPRKHQMRDNPDSGNYKVHLNLAPGKYEYKFIVDGTWQADPNCPDSVPNDQGSINSVVSV